MESKQHIASVLANKELEKKYSLPDSKRGKHVLSVYEKLRNRIFREVKHKKLIGDIFINDEEFTILVEYLKIFYHYLLYKSSIECSDLMVCVCMVQIGIRYYDGGYWPHFAKLLNDPTWNTNRQAILGKVCISTLQQYNKYVNDESDRINTILMHGFVANRYFDNLIDFLFAYYRIDLERDLSRNDRDTMRELLSSMKRKDNSNRTYKLVQQTSDAVTANPFGSNIRLRWLLKLIDASFWGEEINIDHNNRLSHLFGEWMNKSKDFALSKGNRGEKQKIFSSPHLLFDINNESFSIHLPSQIVKNNDCIVWNISLENRTITIPIEAFESVLAYKTESHIVNIKSNELFDRMTFELDYSGNSKKFILPKEDIRFFTKEGYSVAPTSIKSGEYYAFATKEVSVESTALIDSHAFAGLMYYYFVFEDGDLLKLPDGTAVCIGKHIEEGLVTHNSLNGVISDIGGPVYNAVPSVLIKIKESSLSGTAVSVNGIKYRLIDQCVPIIINIDEGKKEKGFWFSLENLGCTQDGNYDVNVDVPNDRSVRHWKFSLIMNLKYSFDDQAPYVFSAKGSLVFSNITTSIKCRTSNVTYDQNDRSFNFNVSHENRLLQFSIENVQFSVLVPMLEYSFDYCKWNTQKYNTMWYTDFPTKLWIKYPSSKIKIEIDGISIGEETSESFTKRTSDDVFECDLTRFKSWIDNERIQNKLFLYLTDKPVAFIDIIARSYVLNGIIEADTDNNKLSIKCDIIGKGDYFVDLYCNDEQLADKIQLIDGYAEIDGRVRSGKYHMEVFETESSEDFWFDDTTYKQIYKLNVEVVNPHDLTGKSIKLISVMKDENDFFKMHFERKYQIKNLSIIDEGDEFRYKGTLIDIDSSNSIADAVVEFFNLNQLKYVMITWIDPTYGDELEFLYDYLKKQIVCEEQPGLSPSEKYRRYEPLFIDDYFFEVNF